MIDFTRGISTLVGAGVAGFLIWLAAQIGTGSSSEYWTTYGLIAAAGLTMALSQILGGWTKWGWPRISPGVFLLGFLPVLVVGGWVLLVPPARRLLQHVELVARPRRRRRRERPRRGARRRRIRDRTDVRAHLRHDGPAARELDGSATTGDEPRVDTGRSNRPRDRDADEALTAERSAGARRRESSTMAVAATDCAAWGRGANETRAEPRSFPRARDRAAAPACADRSQ